MSKTITKIGKKECKMLRDEVALALGAALEDLGLKVHLGNMTYSGDTVSFKTTVSVESYDHDEKEFNGACWKFGLEPKHRGMFFTTGGERYELVGIKPRSHKYPFIGQRVDGKKYKFARKVVTVETLSAA